MKIVYFGSDVFLDVFKFLMQKNEILALYTYHQDEDYFNEENIVSMARVHNISVYYHKMESDEMKRWLDDGCDLFFVAEYSFKLPVAEDERFRGINIHSSLLPQGRSYYPIECAMERQLDTTGVTMHKLASAIDSGDILAQRSYPIEQNDDSIDIYLKSAKNALEMTKEVMADFEKAWCGAVKQHVNQPYWKRPNGELMTLNHNMTVAEAKEIYRKYNKMTVVIINSRLYYVDSFSTGNVALDGDMIFVHKQRVLYGLKDGHIRLDIYAVPAEKSVI